MNMDQRLEASDMRNHYLTKTFARAGFLSGFGKRQVGYLAFGGKYPTVDRSLIFPPEFTHGLVDKRGRGVNVFTTDVGVAATALHEQERLQDALHEGSARGYDSACSFQAAAVGLHAQGKLPDFKALFLATQPCETSKQTFETLYRNKAPIYVLDVPTNRISKASVDNTKSQLRYFAKDVEKDTGGQIRMSEENLKEAIRASNKARAHFSEGIEQMKGPGRLVLGREYANYVFFCSDGFGTEEYSEIARRFEEEMKERRRYLDAHPEEIVERPRIFLVHFPPFSYKEFMKDYVDPQADIVAADVNTIWWDPIPETGDPFEALAVKMHGNGGLAWNARNRAEVKHREILRDYDVDGVISIQHMYGTNCPMASGSSIKMLQEETDRANISEGKNIRLLNVQIDCLRSTDVPVGGMPIDAFFEGIRISKGLPIFRTDERTYELYL